MICHMLSVVIVSIKNFYILISFLRAFLERNWGLITRVFNYRYHYRPFPHQLLVLKKLPSFSFSMYFLITFKLEICYRYFGNCLTFSVFVILLTHDFGVNALKKTLKCVYLYKTALKKLL